MLSPRDLPYLLDPAVAWHMISSVSIPWQSDARTAGRLLSELTTTHVSVADQILMWRSWEILSQARFHCAERGVMHRS